MCFWSCHCGNESCLTLSYQVIEAEFCNQQPCCEQCTEWDCTAEEIVEPDADKCAAAAAARTS